MVYLFVLFIDYIHCLIRVVCCGIKADQYGRFKIYSGAANIFLVEEFDCVKMVIDFL